MKKIGIMSMQRIANYGSYLQAFALKSICEQLGNKVEFVDYHVGKTIIAPKSNSKFHKYFEILFKNGKLIDKIKYFKFKKKYNKYLNELGVTSYYNYNPNLDTLIIGSDEVFNCIQANSNVGFSPELFGVDNKCNTLVSYAASFGNTTLEKIEKYELCSILKTYFENFNSISVRDINSYKIVNNLINVTPKILIDPVLLYGFSNELDKFSTSPSKDKYLIIYGYSGRLTKNETKQIYRYAKMKGLKVYCIGGFQYKCDKYINCPPLEVLRYFKFSEEIITDTFHGTIFSIICHKQFRTIIRKSQGDSYGNEEKLSYLLESLELEQCLIDDLTKLELVSIDYLNVEKILEEKRLEGLNYLKTSI